MKQKYIFVSQFFLGFLVLGVSIFSTSSVKYVFSQAPYPSHAPRAIAQIDYEILDPAITPDSILWPIQAIIDRTEFSGEDLLENADTRLFSGRNMVNKGETERGFVVLEKAEQYLLKSWGAVYLLPQSNKRDEEVYKMALASLKHRQVLEETLAMSPDDGRAVVIKMMDYSKLVYERAEAELLIRGITPPVNPF